MAQRPKPGSKSERDSLRHEMLTAGCSLADIAAEMRAQFGFRPREAWRHANGWSLQEAADRLNSASAERPDPVAADASLVGKWEKWPVTAGRRPSPNLLSLMADVYGCDDASQLLDLEDRRLMPHDATPAVPRRRTAPERTAPEPAANPTGAAAVLEAASESASWAAWAETTNIGEIALDQLQSDVRTLASDYLSGDAVAVFTRTRELRDTTFRLLEGHQSPRQSADLYVSAGYLCALLAWMSSDLGNLAAADTHGRTAWLCAEKAEHNGLRAWTASTRSKVAFWDGRLNDAVNHARRGISYAAAGTVTALLACQEADAWSKLGAVEETRAALHRADSARESINGNDEVGGLFSCSIGRQEQYAAGAHLRVRLYGEALDEADSALRHLQEQPVRAYGTEAQTSLSRAMGHVGLGEADAVLDVLLPVLNMPPQQRLDTIVGRTRDLISMMANSPGARGAASVRARTELADWVQDSAPRRLALSPGAVPA